MTSARRWGLARRARDATGRAVRDLTPGQRWTSALMVGLALVVLGFGLPSATRTVLPAAASEVDDPADRSRDQWSAPASPALTDMLVRPLLTPSPPVDLPVEQDADLVAVPVAPAVSVAALYDPAATFGGRTDEAMGRRFLAMAGVSATFLPIDDVDAACAALNGSTLAVAGGPLPEEIRTCLRHAGVLSLSFDDDATLGPADTAVSTRRGVARSLFDTAAVASAELTGPLGLVADDRLRGRIGSLLPAVRGAGLDVTTVVWLPPGEPPASVALTLASAGLSGVVFATTVQNQSAIGAQLRMLAPGTRLAVLDAADSVTSSAYPPVFDGAIAVTSVQHPWHAGAEAQRAACRTTWEAAQTPPIILDSRELLRALTWCQHAAMAASVVERATSSGLRGALLGLEVTSPITSPLARLRDGGYGPSAVTQVTWAAACSCWSSSAPFAPSESTHG